MGWISNKTRKTFDKIFKNLSEDVKESIDKIQIGIYYENGNHKYEVYKNFVKEKDIDLDDYTGNMFNAGVGVVDTTIAQAGPKYAKDLSVNGNEFTTDNIKIIMQYNPNGLPYAVLMCENKKIRLIDIEKEFLPS